MRIQDVLNFINIFFGDWLLVVILPKNSFGALFDDIVEYFLVGSLAFVFKIEWRHDSQQPDESEQVEASLVLRDRLVLILIDMVAEVGVDLLPDVYEEVSVSLLVARNDLDEEFNHRYQDIQALQTELLILVVGVGAQTFEQLLGPLHNERLK